MKKFEEISPDYLKKLAEKNKESRVYKPYQLTGLRLAELLEDNQHKSLYIGLAKKHDNQQLIEVASQIAENNQVKNKGAYFMSIWFKKK